MYLYVKSLYINRFMFPEFDNVNTTSYCATLHTHLLPSVPNLRLGCHGNIVVLPELLILIHGQAWTTQQVWEKKKGVCVCIRGGACPCMCHVLPVCVCTSQFCKIINILSNILTSGLCVVRIVFFAQDMHNDKISPNHEFVMWLLTRPVTHSHQSSRSVLAACHVVSVELVLTSLSSVRPPCSFYTLTTSFHGMNNWTHTQMCP